MKDIAHDLRMEASTVDYIRTETLMLKAADMIEQLQRELEEARKDAEKARYDALSQAHFHMTGSFLDDAARQQQG